MKSSTVWRGHSTRPFLPAGTARRASGHLSGRRPLHLANARPFGRLKAPLGLLLLRKRELALAGRAGSSHYQQRETERSRRGTPCCTYRYRLWSLAGCVRRGAPYFCFIMVGCTSNRITATPYRFLPASARTTRWRCPHRVLPLPDERTSNRVRHRASA